MLLKLIFFFKNRFHNPTNSSCENIYPTCYLKVYSIGKVTTIILYPTYIYIVILQGYIYIYCTIQGPQLLIDYNIFILLRRIY